MVGTHEQKRPAGLNPIGPAVVATAPAGERDPQAAPARVEKRKEGKKGRREEGKKEGRKEGKKERR